MIMSMMVMMVTLTTKVNVVRLPAQSPEQQPYSHASDQQSAAHSKCELHLLPRCVRRDEREHGGEDQHRSRVRQRRDDAEKQRVPDRAALSHQIRGHQGLAVAWRQRVSRPEP